MAKKNNLKPKPYKKNNIERWEHLTGHELQEFSTKFYTRDQIRALAAKYGVKSYSKYKNADDLVEVVKQTDGWKKAAKALTKTSSPKPPPKKQPAPKLALPPATKAVENDVIDVIAEVVDVEIVKENLTGIVLAENTAENTTRVYNKVDKYIDDLKEEAIDNFNKAVDEIKDKTDELFEELEKKNKEFFEKAKFKKNVVNVPLPDELKNSAGFGKGLPPALYTKGMDGRYPLTFQNDIDHAIWYAGGTPKRPGGRSDKQKKVREWLFSLGLSYDDIVEHRKKIIESIRKQIEVLSSLSGGLQSNDIYVPSVDQSFTINQEEEVEEEEVEEFDPDDTPLSWMNTDDDDDESKLDDLLDNIRNEKEDEPLPNLDDLLGSIRNDDSTKEVAEVAAQTVTEASSDESKLDDFPEWLKEELTGVINKNKQKKKYHKTNTDILNSITSQFSRISGQLEAINQNIINQNNLIKTSIDSSLAVFEKISEQDVVIGSKLDAVLIAFKEQNELAREMADKAEDAEAERRFEEKRKAAGTFGFKDKKGKSFDAIPNLIVGALKKLIKKTPLGKLLGRAGGKIGALLPKEITVADRIVSSIFKGNINPITKKTSSSVPSLSRTASKIVTSNAAKMQEGSIAKMLGKSQKNPTKKKIVQQVFKGTTDAGLTITGGKAPLLTEIVRDAKAANMSDEQIEALVKQFSLGDQEKVFQKVVTETGTEATEKVTQKATNQVATEIATEGSESVLKRIITSNKFYQTVADKLGPTAAGKLLTKSGVKMLPFLGTAYGVIEGIVRTSLGDAKGGALSMGAAIPIAGWGFTALDLFRELDIDAYTKIIEPSIMRGQLPSDEDINKYLQEAFGTSVSDYETGNVNVFSPQAQNETARQLVGISSAFLSGLGPLADSIKPQFRSDLEYLRQVFGAAPVLSTMNITGVVPTLNIKSNEKVAKEEEEFLSEDPNTVADKLFKFIDISRLLSFLNPISKLKQLANDAKNAGINLISSAKNTMDNILDSITGNETEPSGIPSGKLGNMIIHPSTNKIITSNYGMREHPVTGGYKMHHGIDFAGDVGDPVYTPKDGIVKFVIQGAKLRNGSGHSQHIRIQHQDGTETEYFHVASKVRKGQEVKAGQKIAIVSDTDTWSTGPHLDFRYLVNGEYKNPNLLLEKSILMDDIEKGRVEGVYLNSPSGVPTNKPNRMNIEKILSTKNFGLEVGQSKKFKFDGRNFRAQRTEGGFEFHEDKLFGSKIDTSGGKNSAIMEQFVSTQGQTNIQPPQRTDPFVTIRDIDGISENGSIVIINNVDEAPEIGGVQFKQVGETFETTREVTNTIKSLIESRIGQ